MNIKQAFNYLKQQLSKAGIDDPAFDAVYLFEHIFSMSKTDIIIHSDDEIDEDKLSQLDDCIRRRANNEPLQYIIGKWYFMDNPYLVSDGVLIPRDDTEVLVNACINIIRKSKCTKIIDLCSGSGIIAITLKKLFPDADVYAVEKSDIAFDYLSKNCKLNNAEVFKIHADLYDSHCDFEEGAYDLIVSNPPYIISDEIKTLQREVQFEPQLALDGGRDGYDFYKGIITHYRDKLKIGGYIAFEIGEGQFEFIKDLLLHNGFEDVNGFIDISGTIRAMTAVYNP